MHGRQVEGLTSASIDDVRKLHATSREEYDSGTMTEYQWRVVLDVTHRAARELAKATVIEGCPDWCNAHQLAYDVISEDYDTNEHRHSVPAAGEAVEIEKDCDLGLLV